MARDRHDTSNTSSPALNRRARRFPRRVVTLDGEFSPVNIRLHVPTNISTIQGTIKNMSPAGLFVELPALYRVGTRFQVRVKIEDSLRTFYAIVWRVDLTRGDNQPPVYGHGMKITTAGEDTLNALMMFVNGDLEAVAS